MASPTRNALGAVAAFALVGATLLASQLSSRVFLDLSILCFALAVVAPFVLGLRRGIDAADALYPFVLYYALAMGVRGLALLGAEDSPYLAAVQEPRSALFQGLMGWMFLLSALGLVALVLGYRSGVGAGVGDRLARRLAARSWQPRRASIVALVWLGLGLAGAALFTRTFGGLLGAAHNLVFVATEGSLGHFWELVLMEFAVVGLHVLLLGELTRPERRVRWERVLPVGALVVSLYLVTSSKFLLLRALLPPLLFVHLLRRRIGVTRLALFFLAFGALFPFFYAYRLFGLGDWGAIFAQLQAGSHDSWFAAVPLLGRAYDADSFVAVLRDTGRTVPFRFGGSLLDLFTFFVPRALWAAKPLSYGLQFADSYFGDVNLGALNFVSPSLPGELYLNFHVPGILLGMFGLGVLLRVAHRIALAGRAAGALLYGYFYLFAVHLVEGSVAAQIELLLLSVAPAWLAIRAMDQRPVRSTPGPELVAAPAAGSTGGPQG